MSSFVTRKHLSFPKKRSKLAVTYCFAILLFHVRVIFVKGLQMKHLRSIFRPQLRARILGQGHHRGGKTRCHSCSSATGNASLGLTPLAAAAGVLGSEGTQMYPQPCFSCGAKELSGIICHNLFSVPLLCVARGFLSAVLCCLFCSLHRGTRFSQE